MPARRWFVDYMLRPRLQTSTGREGHITSTTVDDSGLMVLLADCYQIDVLTHEAHSLMVKLQNGTAVIWPDTGNGCYSGF